MTATAFGTLVLRLDAVANVALAAGMLALRGLLTSAAGLDSSWPLGVGAVLLAANGVLCWSAARSGSPSPGALRGLAGIDAVFVIAVLAVGLANSTAPAQWLPVALIGLAVVVAVVAAAKLVVAQRLAPQRAAVVQR